MCLLLGRVYDRSKDNIADDDVKLCCKARAGEVAPR